MKKISGIKLAVFSQFSFFFILLTIEISIFILSVIRDKFIINFNTLSFAALIAFTVISFIIITVVLRKNFSKQIILIKNDFLIYLKLISSLVDIIIQYNQSLDMTLSTIDDDYDNCLQKGNFENLTNINNLLKEKEKTINELFDNYNMNTMKLVITELKDFYGIIENFSSHVSKNIELYKCDSFEMKALNKTVLINTSKLLYNLGISIPILSDISVASNDFSLNMIRNIFNKFDTVSNYSQNIYKSTQETINSFMDYNSKDSLAYISEETKNIKSKIEDFFKTMSDLKKVSDNFLNNSVSSLKEMETTSSNVEDISEKIKLIAINVRIEASHLGDDTGFKVLGKEISDFAEITSKIAKDSYKRIKNTTISIESMKNEYLTRLNDVYDYLGKIKESFMPFEDIINNSFNKIKLVIEYMDNFSKGINDKIKETVGALQFHDVTTQESQHIIKFIEELSTLFHHLTKDLNIDNRISEFEKKEISKMVISKLLELTTTENERKIIHEYSGKFGIEIEESAEELKDIKKLDDQTLLF